MELATLTAIDSMQFGSYLFTKGLITWIQLQEALRLQKERPFLHLGEVLCLVGAIEESQLAKVAPGHHRESRLGSILLAKGNITLAELTDALSLQATSHLPLGEILVERGYIDRHDLDRSLFEQDGQPYPPSRDLFDKCRELTCFRDAQEQGRYPFFLPLQASESPRTWVDGKEVLLLASNSYLGLSSDPTAIEAAVEATRHYGIGTSGSPLLNGTMDLHVALEAQLCSLMGKEACALFSTGYQTNLGIISGLVGREDIVLVDSLAHASIHDASRLSLGTFKRFNHNNMDDLERLLRQAGTHGKLIVVDGVYSMDGDTAYLPGIVQLARAHGAKILLDDAHGFGVLGARGRGTAEYYGLMSEIDLVMLTFSKSLGTVGGCVLGDDAVIHYLKHRSRPYLFSASLPPGTVAATMATLQRSMSDPSLRQQLEENVNFLRAGLHELGFNLGSSNSHIIPVIIGDEALTLQTGMELLREGVMVATVISPGVPVGLARLRVSLMASHTRRELQEALAAFERVGMRLGIISRESGVPFPGPSLLPATR